MNTEHATQLFKAFYNTMQKTESVKDGMSVFGNLFDSYQTENGYRIPMNIWKEHTGINAEDMPTRERPTKTRIGMMPLTSDGWIFADTDIVVIFD